MKKILVIMIIVTLALVAVAISLPSLSFIANNVPKKTSWSSSVTRVTEEGEERTEFMEGWAVNGRISKIGKDHIIIDESLNLEVNERTKVYDNGAEITFDDLKKGDMVRVHYTNNLEALYISRHQKR